MKTTLALAVVAAIAAVACGAPGAPTRSLKIDWARVEVLVNNFEQLVQNTSRSFAKMAMDADPVVGPKIANLVRSACEKNQLVCARLHGDVNNQTLNADKMDDYLVEIANNLKAIAADVRDLLEKLPENVVDRMNDLLENAGETFEEIIDELFEILPEGRKMSKIY